MAEELALEDGERQFLQKKFDAACTLYRNLSGDAPEEKKFSARTPPLKEVGLIDEGVFRKYCTQWHQWNVVERVGNPSDMEYRFVCDLNEITLDEVLDVAAVSDEPDEEDGEVIDLEEARAKKPVDEEPKGPAADKPFRKPPARAKPRKRAVRAKPEVSTKRPEAMDGSLAVLAKELRVTAINLGNRIAAEQAAFAIKQTLGQLTPAQLHIARKLLGIKA